jgi:hypothetical protein
MPISQGTTAFFNQISHAVDLIVKNNLQQKARLTELQKIQMRNQAKADEAEQRTKEARERLVAQRNSKISTDPWATPEARQSATQNLSQYVGQDVPLYQPQTVDITSATPNMWGGKDIVKEVGALPAKDAVNFAARVNTTARPRSGGVNTGNLFNFGGRRQKKSYVLSTIDKQKRTLNTKYKRTQKKLDTLKKQLQSDIDLITLQGQGNAEGYKKLLEERGYSKKLTDLQNEITRLSETEQFLDDLSGQISVANSSDDVPLWGDYLKLIHYITGKKDPAQDAPANPFKVEPKKNDTPAQPDTSSTVKGKAANTEEVAKQFLKLAKEVKASLKNFKLED